MSKPLGRFQPARLARRIAARLPKKKITIYCEGENTEPHYFLSLSKHAGNSLVEVNAIGAAGAPKTLVEKASKQAKRRKKDSYESKDEIWAAFDRDEHENVPQAFDMAKANGVNIAFSNPCFEIWLILHLEDFDAPDGRHAVQKKLKTLLKGYDPKHGKTFQFSEISGGVSDARNRSKAMRKRRTAEGSPKGPPFTDVDLLVQSILGDDGST